MRGAGRLPWLVLPSCLALFKAARALAASLLLTVVWPSLAFAHSPIEGFEGFYTGFIHPLINPVQFLSLLALSLMLGLNFPAKFSAALKLFSLGILIGVGVAFLDWEPTYSELILLGLGCLIAGVAALLPAYFPTGFLLLPGLMGVMIGIVSLPDPGPLRAMLFTLSGSVIGAVFFLAYLVTVIGILREKIQAAALDIGLRIIAAWIAAISILMLALFFA